MPRHARGRRVRAAGVPFMRWRVHAVARSRCQPAMASLFARHAAAFAQPIEILGCVTPSPWISTRLHPIHSHKLQTHPPGNGSSGSGQPHQCQPPGMVQRLVGRGGRTHAFATGATSSGLVRSLSDELRFDAAGSGSLGTTQAASPTPRSETTRAVRRRWAMRRSIEVLRAAGHSFVMMVVLSK
jgi:hypothetical protein